MNSLVQSYGSFGQKFFSVFFHTVLMLGLIIALYSLGRVAFKFITVKNAEDKALASSNLLDICIGVVALGAISGIMAYFILLFFN